MKKLLIFTGFIIVLFIGFWINDLITKPEVITTTIQDTLYIPQEPDTIFVQGDIHYIHTTDTIIQKVSVTDSVASIDTTFKDGGRLIIDYFYRDQWFSIFRKPPSIANITNTEHTTSIEYKYRPLKWYDGIGVSVGYDPFSKDIVFSIGYSITIGSVKGMLVK